MNPLGRILGVDPGAVEGGWVVLDAIGKFISVGDLPGAQRLISGPLCTVIVEPPSDQASPSLSAAARSRGTMSPRRSSFGRGLGIVEGVISGAMIPSPTSPAAVWKRHFHLGKDKEGTQPRAMEIWPGHGIVYFTRKRDHSRAEARRNHADPGGGGGGVSGCAMTALAFGEINALALASGRFGKIDLACPSCGPL